MFSHESYPESADQTLTDDFKARQGHSAWAVVQDIVLDATNRRRLFLAVMLFLFHKFTGTDSLNYYAPSIFELIGVKGNSNTLLTTVSGNLRPAT